LKGGGAPASVHGEKDQETSEKQTNKSRFRHSLGHGDAFGTEKWSSLTEVAESSVGSNLISNSKAYIAYAGGAEIHAYGVSQRDTVRDVSMLTACP